MDIESYWSTRRSMIELRLRKIPEELSNDPEIVEISNYILSGGKRLRGVLTLLVAEALGGRLEYALDAATAVEMVHAASLVHDDIIDGDTVRRGKPAAWLKYGVSKALLIPHLLVSHAQVIIEKYGIEALQVTIRAWKDVTLGEYEDVTRGSHYNGLAYEKIALYKTGALFGVAAALGAIAAGRKDLIDKAKAYGDYLGYTFQVADDIVDLYKFLSGTLDLRSSPSLNSFLAWVYDNTPYSTIREEEPLVKAIIKLEGILKEASHKAALLLNNLKDSTYKELLEKLPSYAALKMLEEGQVKTFQNTCIPYKLKN